MARAHELSQAPNVTVVGPVRNTNIPWTEGLTLAQALITAQYIPSKDPSLIVILRHGRPILVTPKQLLQGDDVPLELGDVVDIKQ